MIKPFTEALAIITEVMRHGAASHPDNERSVSMESMGLIAFSLRAKSAALLTTSLPHDALR
jgi:hypothetical protein